MALRDQVRRDRKVLVLVSLAGTKLRGVGHYRPPISGLRAALPVTAAALLVLIRRVERVHHVAERDQRQQRPPSSGDSRRNRNIGMNDTAMMSLTSSGPLMRAAPWPKSANNTA